MSAALSVPAGEAAAAWSNRLCGLLAAFAWLLTLGALWASPRRSA